MAKATASQTLIDALRDNLSPAAVAAISAFIHDVRTPDEDVNRQAAWLADLMVDAVGGLESYSRLCDGLRL